MPEVNAHRVYTTYLREKLHVHVENTSSPLQRWFSASEKHLKNSRRLSFVHLFTIRQVTSMDLKCGNSIITKQMMRCELLQGRRTEPLRMFGIDGKTIWITENPKKPLVGTMRLHDISNTSYRLISLTKRLLSNEADITIWYIYVVWWKVCKPLRKWPGYHEAKLTITEVWWQSGREMNIVHVPTKEGKRLNDKLDPKIREYLVWVSENWRQYFAKERELPTSSSSSQWSSTSWWSSHEWSSTRKG